MVSSSRWQALDVQAIQYSDAVVNYRKKVPMGDDFCVAANNGHQVAGVQTSGIVDSCAHADRAEILQAIMFPTAAVGLAAGAYLTGTSFFEAKGDQVAIAPILSPGLQGVTVAGTF